jgi:DNA-binding NtrC family response regulator
MEVGSLLIAETDPSVLQSFPQFLSGRLPQLDIQLAATADEAQWKMSRARYSAAVVASDLVKDNPSLRLHRIQNRSVLMPVIVTAAKADVDSAREALIYRGAFDVIAKPIHHTEALASIRVALWQARFLRLLTQRDRVLDQFKRHIETYPEEVETRAAIGKALEHVEAALTAVRQSMILVDPDSDQLFFDLAASVEERTKDRALDRLNRLIVSGR